MSEQEPETKIVEHKLSDDSTVWSVLLFHNGFGASIEFDCVNEEHARRLQAELGLCVDTHRIG